jgi:outer membrane lipoprotein LolB
MNRFVMRKYALAIALPLLLGGCAGMIPATQTSPPAPQAAPVRPYADNLDLGGRISVRYQNNGKDEAMHGSFVWTQNPTHTGVTLLSPLGQTIAIIDVTPDGATLAQSGQPVRGAADVDALMTDALGWPLPVSGLRGWLQGFAVDAAGRRFVASSETNDVATRDGWRIRYASWQDDGQAQHPRRIDLDRRTMQAGDVSIRIVIDTWQPRQ